MTEERMEGGTYRFWSDKLHLVHEAGWSLLKWCSWLTPGPVDNLPPCIPLPPEPPRVLERGHTALQQGKNHFKGSMLVSLSFSGRTLDRELLLCAFCVFCWARDCGRH